MNKILALLSGKKTYIAALCWVVFAGSGYYLDQLSAQQAFSDFLIGLSLIGLRGAAAKVIESLKTLNNELSSLRSEVKPRRG